MPSSLHQSTLHRMSAPSLYITWPAPEINPMALPYHNRFVRQLAAYQETKDTAAVRMPDFNFVFVPILKWYQATKDIGRNLFRAVVTSAVLNFPWYDGTISIPYCLIGTAKDFSLFSEMDPRDLLELQWSKIDIKAHFQHENHYGSYGKLMASSFLKIYPCIAVVDGVFLPFVHPY
ncbi:cb19dbfa-521d-48fd-ae14-8f34e0ee1d19 [Sclerotinia trifoliorum]|uniref:Cb19dbfa-521d-48fd-ae14-8f34e0ee1d19 n=1 Tax=Sclerotinia trifoliorum TaxID=28548 RepID=A0A8H2VSK2_9HELO|nr:cb19dbfa-521d-48fd-ae14-8f34e0ee1d19 [Sclerotinia trifoliorum]